MTLQVTKRNGTLQPWDSSKISRAITLASQRSKETVDIALITHFAADQADLQYALSTSITVDQIHKIVEDLLMRNGYLDTAREYITYRFSHMPDIFRPRATYRPFEYPELHKYVDAIRKSYWIHDEFNFTSDIQDFRVNLTPEEAQAVRRTMLAISHVEATVKTFWAKIGDRMPKAEIAEVGITFGESEVRHGNAYAEILNLLGLNNDFEAITKVPVFQQRHQYMQYAMSTASSDNLGYLKALMFFSMFIENVSLFSQFLIIMVINQKQNMLKGISNVISATALEENTHYLFGVDIVNIVRSEHPEWFDETLKKDVYDLVIKSFEAEKAIIDWIFEAGEIPAISKNTVTEYIKSRYNQGLVAIGYKAYFEVDASALKETELFDLQLATTTHVDFFHKRSSNYTKNAMSFDPDLLF